MKMMTACTASGGSSKEVRKGVDVTTPINFLEVTPRDHQLE